MKYREVDSVDATEYLTIKQVCKLLDVGQTSVRLYIREGFIEAHRIGGMSVLRIHRDELKKLLVPIEKGV